MSNTITPLLESQQTVNNKKLDPTKSGRSKFNIKSIYKHDKTPMTNCSPSSPVSNCSVLTSTFHSAIDQDDFTTSSSIMEFLKKEQECQDDFDADSIFQELSRFTDNSDTRSVDEILREAELLMQRQQSMINRKEFKRSTSNECEKYQKLTKTPENTVTRNKKCTYFGSSKACDILKPKTPTYKEQETNNISNLTNGDRFEIFVENLPTESVLSEESTPKELNNLTEVIDEDGSDINLQHSKVNKQSDDTDNGSDTVGYANLSVIKFSFVSCQNFRYKY